MARSRYFSVTIMEQSENKSAFVKSSRVLNVK